MTKKIILKNFFIIEYLYEMQKSIEIVNFVLFVDYDFIRETLTKCKVEKIDNGLLTY